jgi:hypothetical protein
MQQAKGVSTPMAAIEKLSRQDGVALSYDDSIKYRSVVGAL